MAQKARAREEQQFGLIMSLQTQCSVKPAPCASVTVLLPRWLICPRSGRCGSGF